MTEWTMKRFWTEASTAAVDDGHAVLLDGRPVRTPAKAPLTLPSLALARAVAAEWDAQDKVVDPRRMPLTRMANSAIDKVAPQHAAVAGLLADYGGSDLLCYRATGPDELVARQAEWDRWLDWAAQALGARLVATVGVMPVAQDPSALDRLAAAVRALPPFELAPFHDLVALSGSLVLGFGVERGALDGAGAWRLSRLDEDFQIERWGADDEAAEAAAAKRSDLLKAEEFLALVRG